MRRLTATLVVGGMLLFGLAPAAGAGTPPDCSLFAKTNIVSFIEINSGKQFGFNTSGGAQELPPGLDVVPTCHQFGVS